MKYTYLFCELKSTIGYHSTVEDFPIPTKLNNLIPFVTFIYGFKINKKGLMIEEKYSDFEMGFYES